MALAAETVLACGRKRHRECAIYEEGMRLLLLSGILPMLAFAQINASSDLRPVALEMNETDGTLTFSLKNQFNRSVTAYWIKVWTFRNGVPKQVCTLASDSISSPREARITVSGSCTIPRDPASGGLVRYSAKLTSVRVDGRLMHYEPIPLSNSSPARGR